MKYTNKFSKTDPELSAQLLEAGWTKIKEPQNFALATVLSIPFVFLLGGIVMWLAYLLKPTLFSFVASGSMIITFSLVGILLFVGATFAETFLHEMIHAMFIPNFIKSKKTFWGMNAMLGFVFTTEPMKKGRFLLMSCMPFVLLSIVPVLLLNAMGYLNWYLLLFCILNATGSCVDFLNMALIGFQVKANRTIVSNGFETFYNGTK